MKPKSPCEIRKCRFPQTDCFFRSDMGEWREYWPTPGDEGESDQRKFYDFTREFLRESARERAKRMSADYCAGAGAIDIIIPGYELGFDPLNVSGTAREESGGERVIGIVGNSDRVVQIARFQHTQHRPENFTLA